MSRPTVWEPLDGADPTPGDPQKVAAAGKSYETMAAVIKAQIDKLDGLADPGCSRGQYVKTLTTAGERLKDEFRTLDERYREVGGQLRIWSVSLDGYQWRAELLLRRAVTANGEMSDNRALPQMRPVDAGPPPDAEAAAAIAEAIAAANAAANARQGRFDDASGDMRRVQSELTELKDERNREAATIAELISTKSNQYNDDPWQSFKNFMDDHHELITRFCDVMGDIAMIVLVVAVVLAICIPGVGLGVLAVIGTIASVASLAGHTALASTGHGSWGDVALDVLGLVTLGAGKFIGPGLKVGTKAFSKTFGGKGGKLLQGTKDMGAVGRGRDAVIKAHKKTLFVLRGHGSSNGLSRAEVRANGRIRADQAWDAAQAPAAVPKGTVLKRAWETVKGGGDIDLTHSRKVIADNADNIGRHNKADYDIASKAATNNKWQTGLTGVQNTAQVGDWGATKVANLSGPETETPRTPYEAWKKSWTTRAIGDLPGSEELRLARQPEYAK
jgi:hypothetical protein